MKIPVDNQPANRIVAARNFEPLEDRFFGVRPAKTLLRLYETQRWRLGAAVFFFVIKHSPVWLMPVLTANIVEIVAHPAQHSKSALWINASILAGLFVQNIPLHFVYGLFVSKAVRAMELNLRSALCRRLQHLSIGYYARQSAAVLQTKVLRDVELIEQLTRVIFDTGLSCVINIVFAIIITGVRQPWFLIFFLMSIPVTVLTVYVLRRPLAERNARFREEVEQFSTQVGEMTNLLPITRAHGLESVAIKRVDQSLVRLREAGLRVDMTNALFGSASWAAMNLFNGTCLVASAALALSGILPISPGDVVLLTTYFTLITTSILGLIGATPQIFGGLEAIRSMGEILQCPDLEQNEGKSQICAVRGCFVFDDVSFVYPGTAEAALRNFSLKVHEGQVIAMIGPSGAGKSTVLNLVIGFIRPTAGRMLLDGHDMNGCDLRTYRRFLAVVPQESILFDGTIRENVTYGLSSVSDDAVISALRAANAWEFVSQEKAGLDTRVGSKGARFSGGQKQRLAIARAFIRNPRVLILDEATSSLDSDSESQIQDALQQLMQNRTTFVVAHRLSTIRNADRIVVLDRGSVAGFGTHEELLSSNALYFRFHAKQSGIMA